jgi:hypothetical protein
MIKIGSRIPQLLKPKTKDQDSFQIFLLSKKFVEDCPVIQKWKNDIKNILLLDDYDPLDTPYNDFILNTSIFPKNIDTLYQYIAENSQYKWNHRWGISLQEITTFIRHKTDRIAQEFLSHKQQYDSLDPSAFYNYIKQQHTDLIWFISFDDISVIYIKTYREYFSELGKNEYGIDMNKVFHHLTHMIKDQQVGDGSFLYEWQTANDSWIKKYLAWAQNPLYASIKADEKKLYEYLFNWNNCSYAAKLRKIIRNSENIVELWSGWVSKLKDTLGLSLWTNSLAYFLSEKESIILSDVSSDGFISVRQDLNKTIWSDKVVGVEWDFRDKNNPIYWANSPFYFMFGGTIGNFTKEEIHQLLQNMKPRKWWCSHFAFTYFPAPNKNRISPEAYAQEINKLKAMYGDDESNPFFNHEARNTKSDFVLSGFKALGIDSSKLKYIVEYEEATDNHPARIKLWAEFIEDSTIITKDGPYFKKKWEKIWALQSIRFTPQEIEAIANENNYDLLIQVDTTTHPTDSNVGVAILRSKFDLKTHSSIFKNVGIWLAIAWAIYWWGKIYQSVQEKEQSKAQSKIWEDYSRKLTIDKTHNRVYNIDQDIREWELSNDLTDAFIKKYWQGELSKEEISAELHKYLNTSSLGKDFVNNHLSINDIHQSNSLLDDFVNNSFWSQMIFSWKFSSLESIFMRSLSDEQITDMLKTQWIPLEWYQDKEKLYYKTEETEFTDFDIPTSKWRQTIRKVDLITTPLHGYISHEKINTKNIPSSLIWVEYKSRYILQKDKPDQDWNQTISYFNYNEPVNTKNQEHHIRLEDKNGRLLNIYEIADIILENNSTVNKLYTHISLELWINNINISDNQKIINELKKNIVVSLYTPMDMGAWYEKQIKPIHIFNQWVDDWTLSTFSLKFYENNSRLINQIKKELI